MNIGFIDTNAMFFRWKNGRPAAFAEARLDSFERLSVPPNGK